MRKISQNKSRVECNGYEDSDPPCSDGLYNRVVHFHNVARVTCVVVMWRSTTVLVICGTDELLVVFVLPMWISKHD